MKRAKPFSQNGGSENGSAKESHLPPRLLTPGNFDCCWSGAGSRGSSFAQFAQQNPDQARVVGVAEPRPFYRQRVADQNRVLPAHTATDWSELADQPKFADAVIIATPDRYHAEPAVAFAEKGYAILLEKPMATNEAESTFMLLAKSCHDIDWLRYLVGKRCIQVSSFGSLTHFKRDQKPAEAGEALRCLDCAFEPQCPYSARRFYLGRYRTGDYDWPLDVITSEFTEEAVMTAFAEVSDRKTQIFGTRGELRGDLAKIIHYDFLTEKTETIDTTLADSPTGGHWDGDINVLRSFVRAVATGDTSSILSGAEETLETHLTVFAAEKSRRTGKTVKIVL
jgi:predicted dehydrogenase